MINIKLMPKTQKPEIDSCYTNGKIRNKPKKLKILSPSKKALKNNLTENSLKKKIKKAAAPKSKLFEKTDSTKPDSLDETFKIDEKKGEDETHSFLKIIKEMASNPEGL